MRQPYNSRRYKQEGPNGAVDSPRVWTQASTENIVRSTESIRVCSSARNDQRQLECMDQVLDIAMCAGAIGGSLKLKIVFLCAQNQERPRVSPETLFSFYFVGLFFFCPSWTVLQKELLVRLLKFNADNGPRAAQS